jgi:hypothetical protein
MKQFFWGDLTRNDPIAKQLSDYDQQICMLELGKFNSRQIRLLMHGRCEIQNGGCTA